MRIIAFKCIVVDDAEDNLKDRSNKYITCYVPYLRHFVNRRRSGEILKINVGRLERYYDV